MGKSYFDKPNNFVMFISRNDIAPMPIKTSRLVTMHN